MNNMKPMTFADLRRIVEETPSRWNDCTITVTFEGNPVLAQKFVLSFAQATIKDMAFSSGLAARPEGSSAAQWYGVSDAVPPSVEIIITKD